MTDAGDEPRLPDELAALMRQFGAGHLGQADTTDQIRRLLTSSGGPVNWDLARQVALQIAAEEDRSPTEEEVQRAEDAQRLAEHWLDEGSLPAPPDAGRLLVASRQSWVNAALDGLRRLVEPVAAGSIRALADVVREQTGDLDGTQLGAAGLPEGLDEARMPGGRDLSGLDVEDLAGMLEPVGGFLMGMQTGQVIGQLSRQMLGQYDLGIPTAQRATAYRLPRNAVDTFDGYDLDTTEISVVLALHEGAARRQYHAVPWLADHVYGLVESFAAKTTIDTDQLLDVSRGLMVDVDPEDPESLRAAMDRASDIQLEPTAEQRRVLERLQGVICLLQAWARHEVATAAEGRLPGLERIREVLARRRATQGDGERLLARLLGLDLKPDDEEVGDRFVATVREARGLDGLRRALAHPENLPDADELAEPSTWLVRMAGGEEIPDDASALFDGLGDAPVEPPGDQRGHPEEDGP